MPNKIINYIPTGISTALQIDSSNPFALNYIRQRFNTVIPEKILTEGWDAIKEYFEKTELPKGSAPKLDVRNEDIAQIVATVQAMPAVERSIAVPVVFKECTKLKMHGYNNDVNIAGIMRIPESIVLQNNIETFRTWVQEHRHSSHFVAGAADVANSATIEWDYDHMVEIDTVDSEIDDDIEDLLAMARVLVNEERLEETQ